MRPLPEREKLIGYHLNRGKDREGEFISARQLWETFYQPGLIARRLDTDGDERLAEAVKKRGDVRELLRAGQSPELELVSPGQAQSEGSLHDAGSHQEGRCRRRPAGGAG